MRDEMELLQREFPAEGVRCVLSGIGKVNAAVAAERLASDFAPDCILSIGVAGTFVEGLQEGETVIASRTAYHDVWCGYGNEFGQVDGMPRFFDSDSGLLERACEALPAARLGLLCSGDQFYISHEEDERQKRLYPDALAIDMEGAAVAQVCHIHGIPFLAVKIISDNHVSGDQTERYEGFWKDLAEKSFHSVHDILESILR